MNKFKKIFTYFLILFVEPKEFSKALNEASSPYELDILIFGDKENGNHKN